MKESKSYGIVFSGGGALAAWEVGCYDAIKAHHGGKPPAVATGASAGALNAVGACAGMPPPQLEEMWKNILPEDVYRFRFTMWDAASILKGIPRHGLLGSLLKFLKNHKSLHDTTALKATLRKILSGYWNQFVQSETHFALSVTNLSNGRREYFYKLPVGLVLPEDARNRNVVWERIDGLEMLLDALLGSTALPILFPPNAHYFDGGVLMNQPITPAVLLNSPDVLYVVIPTARALGQTNNIIEIGQTVLDIWTSISLISQLDRLQLRNKIRNDRRDANEADLRLPICVIRPPMDLTAQLGINLLSFGLNVSGIVDAGKFAAYEKLQRFDPTNEATWYDVP